MRYALVALFCLFALNIFAEDAKVKFVIGEVAVKKTAGAGDWKKLSLGGVLQEGDMIRTSRQSRCEIELGDGSATKLLENSTLELRNLPKAGNPATELHAGLGKFYFKLKKMATPSFRISTPTSVAAVRGTEFVMINETATSHLFVKSGLIDWSDPALQNMVQVGAGFKSVLRGGAPPEAPTALSPEDLAVIEQAAAESKTPPPEEQVDTRQALESARPPSEIEQTEAPAEEKPQHGSGIGFGAGVSIGAVTIGDKLYNQIGIRPEFSIGKLGVALDLTMYIDEDGNISDENWNSWRDIFEKIYYVRWGVRGDPLYVKVGAIDNYRLGFGILMNRYSNTVEYPNVIRTGVELGLQSGKYGFDAMLNNFSELTNGGGLIGARVAYRPLGALEFGASVVYDRNQYKALKDRDDDGVPDYLDGFPDDKRFAVDTDGDGLTDELDPDRDGDNYTDNPIPDSTYLNDDDFDISNLDPEPFDINKAENKSEIAFALDASYPILNFDYLKLVTYAQWAKFPNSGGWGVTAPGLMAKFAFINAYAEYRIFGEHFLPEYFNTTYELERAVYIEKTSGDSVYNVIPQSKRMTLSRIDEKLKGYVVGADFNIANFVIFGAEYQNMSKSDLKLRTFRSSLDLNTKFIPKLSRAGAYYYQDNAEKIFRRDSGVILGYRVEYEIAPGTALLFDFRQTYRDLNGDGSISGKGETVKTTNIQTVIRF
jgi:hypothetical protein